MPCHAGLCCACSGAAAGGLAACEQGGGDSIIHVGCSDGSLTKMLASKGLRVFGVDADIAAATKRGLKCVSFEGQPLSAGSLAPAAAAAGSGVDCVLIYTPAAAASSSGSSGSGSGGWCVQDSSSLTQGALAELGQVLVPGGRLCAELPLAVAGADGPQEEARLRAALQAAGYTSISCLQVLPGWQQQRVRIMAERGQA